MDAQGGNNRDISERFTDETKRHRKNKATVAFASTPRQLIGNGPKFSGVAFVLLVLCFGVGVVQGKVLDTVGACKVSVDGRLINLDSLQNTDGTPRFDVEWRGWNYSFNPCTSFNLPANPHHGLGDQCPFVSVCKWKMTKAESDDEYYTMGIQSTAKFHTKYKMYQRYRKQVDAQMNDVNPQEKEEVDEEDEEEEESEEEGEESSERSSDEEMDELYDYQYFVEGYALTDDADADVAAVGVEQAIDMDVGIAKRKNGTSIIKLSNQRKHYDLKDSTGRSDYGQDIDQAMENENDTKEDSFIMENTPVAREIPVSKEIQNDRQDPNDTPSKEVPSTTPEAFFHNVDYDHYNKEHQNDDYFSDQTKVDDDDDDNDKKYGSTPTEDDAVLKTPTYTFKAHERRALPYLKFDDFLPILREDSVMLTYRGVKSMRRRWTHILLTCDYRKRAAHAATFKVLAVRGLNIYFELSHRCCCPDACLDAHYLPAVPAVPAVPDALLDSNLTDSYSNGTSLDSDGAGLSGGNVVDVLGPAGAQFLWLVLVVNGSVLACAILIGGMCCKGGGVATGQYTSMLPVIPKRDTPPMWRKGIHSSQQTINSFDSRYFSSMKINSSPDYLDYSSALTRNQQKPVGEDGIVKSHDLDIGQRLGGGLFGDTYVAEYKDRRVAAKRITVGVHQSQLTDADYEWIIREITYLSKQRHKYLVSVLGICTDTRQPYIISEFIEGDSLKDLLLRDDDYLTWPRRIKMSIQIADGLAFLHSARYPILHRDLRCSNVLVEPARDRVKVVDFGMVKIIQRLRQQCTGRADCYCQRELSGLPASVRWSPPEVLYQPSTDEYHSDILCPATDMYSFGMLLWEVAAARDPFQDIADDAEVMEIVRSGGRPLLDEMPGVLPNYKELIKKCWQQEPDHRPSFKQVTVHLKNIAHMLSKMSSRGRTRQHSETTSFLRSALNLTR